MEADVVAADGNGHRLLGAAEHGRPLAERCAASARRSRAVQVEVDVVAADLAGSVDRCSARLSAVVVGSPSGALRPLGAPVPFRWRQSLSPQTATGTACSARLSTVVVGSPSGASSPRFPGAITASEAARHR
ncbi:hypothetical protein [Nocardia amikacinitolerans]|uniref:hypothetical protein n=1 Tax=Nocardia amikacinitolerans TaxID=756689 RepID=UPI000B13D82C|nr:hypothetical protein [Nocardia amikacinitolerans]